jgi:hypothetical protein
MARFNRRSKTPEAALARAIAAIGEPQDVAVELNPIKWKSEPDAGGRWVSHCADPDRREKFSLREVQHIFRRACETGDHSGFEAFAELCGYNATATVPEALLAEALKRGGFGEARSGGNRTRPAKPDRQPPPAGRHARRARQYGRAGMTTIGCRECGRSIRRHNSNHLRCHQCYWVAGRVAAKAHNAVARAGAGGARFQTSRRP